MSIIESLKSLIGYTYNDLDMIFGLIAMIIIMFFVWSLFNILSSIFRSRY